MCFAGIFMLPRLYRFAEPRKIGSALAGVDIIVITEL